MENIENYLKEQGIGYEFTPDKTHLITDCPVCGKEQHAYVNISTGLWDCKVCGSTGNWSKFKKGEAGLKKDTVVLSQRTVDQFRMNMENHLDIYDYLLKRGIHKKVIQAAQLGVNQHGDLAIPYYNKDKNLVAIKFRNMKYEEQLLNYEQAKSENIQIKKPNKWYSIGKPGLYGIDALTTTDELLVCEGEFDRLSAISYGFGNVVAAPGCTTADWIEDLKEIKKIYICYDNDPAGQKGAFDIASRLGLDRCRNIVLPKKDLNECLTAGIPVSEIVKLVKSATLFPVPGICTSDRFKHEVMLDLKEPGQLKGFATGHAKLDKMTRGFKGGQVRVLSGFTSAGKTTWTMNEMLLYAQNNIPVAVFCMESSISDVMKDMISTLAGKYVERLDQSEVLDYIEQLDHLPIYWFDEKNFEGTLGVMKFKELTKMVRDRFGCKFVVIDNMQFLLNFDHSKKNLDEKVTELLTELKLMARTLDVHIIAIAHLNRAAYGQVNRDGVREVKRPQINDLKGSSGYEQTADYVMFVHRDTAPDVDDEIKQQVEIIIAKNRPARVTGVVQFKYDIDSCTYKEEV